MIEEWGFPPPQITRKMDVGQRESVLSFIVSLQLQFMKSRFYPGRKKKCQRQKIPARLICLLKLSGRVRYQHSLMHYWPLFVQKVLKNTVFQQGTMNLQNLDMFRCQVIIDTSLCYSCSDVLWGLSLLCSELIYKI